MADHGNDANKVGGNAQASPASGRSAAIYKTLKVGKDIEDEVNLSNVTGLTEAENIVSRFQSCLDKLQAMNHFGDAIGDDEIGEFQLTQDIIKKSLLRVARMISQLHEKVVLFDDMLDSYNQQVGGLLDVSSGAAGNSGGDKSSSKKNSTRKNNRISKDKDAGDADESSSTTEGSVTEKKRRPSQRSQKPPSKEKGSDEDLEESDVSKKAIFDKKGPNNRSFTVNERYLFSQANLQLYQHYEAIIQQLHGAVSDVRNVQKDLSLSGMEDQRLKKLWEFRFANHGFRMVPWKPFVEVISTATPQPISVNLQKLLKSLLDPHDLGFVSPLSFSKFLVLFGPLREMPNKMKDILEIEWFQSYMDKSAAERLLYGEKKSTFLVRFKSGRTDKLVLDYVKAPGSLVTLSVTVTNDGISYTDEYTNTHSFHSLIELGENLIKTLHWIPFSSPLKSLPYYVSNISSETAAAKTLLSVSAEEGTFLMYLSPDQSASFINFTYVVNENTFKTICLKRTSLGGYQQTPTITTTTITQVESNNMNVATSSATNATADQTSYKGIQEFIHDHKSILRFHYSSNNMPNMRFSPFRATRHTDSNTVSSHNNNSNTNGTPINTNLGTMPSQNKMVELWGPERMDAGVRLVNDVLGICCQTLSTYPKGSLGAQCLCDTFRVRVVGNRVVAVLCDGCSWGKMSREASQKAAKTFAEVLSSDEILSNVTTTEEFTEHLRNALDKAHEAIIHEKEMWTSGTTTLLGGTLLKLHELDQWAFVSISVGDCKGLLWNSRTKKAKDFTIGNRANALNASDPGGRIGPYIGAGSPDLRNLTFHFTPCQPGDFIILMSDGVYDNLDPEQLGTSPKEVFKLMLSQTTDKNGGATVGSASGATAPTTTASVSPYQECEKWDEIPLSERYKIKHACIMQKIDKLISSTNGTPMEITHSFIQNCVDITSKSRFYMENTKGALEPTDYREYPGKMDHSTCVVIKVVDMEDAVEEDEMPKSARFPRQQNSTNKLGESWNRAKPKEQDKRTATTDSVNSEDESSSTQSGFTISSTSLSTLPTSVSSSNLPNGATTDRGKGKKKEKDDEKKDRDTKEISSTSSSNGGSPGKSEPRELEKSKKLKGTQKAISFINAAAKTQSIKKAKLLAGGSSTNDDLEGGFQALSPSSSTYKKFADYLRNQYAYEHLEFFQDVNNFEQNAKTKKEVAEEAGKILKKYFGFGGKSVIISVAPEEMETLKKMVADSSYTIDMFSQMQSDIGELLETQWISFREQHKKKK